MSYYEDYWAKNEIWHPSKGGWRDREEEMLEGVSERGHSLLDYGCGDCERIASGIMEKGIQYEGFDISLTAVEAGRKRGVPAFMLTPEGGVDRPDGAYDGAICLEVLEHLMRPDVAAEEIYRVLKPGSKALISVPNPSYLPQRLEFVLSGFLNPGGSPLTSRAAPWKDAHIRFFTINTMRRMLKEAGFTTCEVYGFNFSFHGFPWLYRQKALFPFYAAVERCLGWLGKVFPSLMAPRWYFVAGK